MWLLFILLISSVRTEDHECVERKLRSVQLGVAFEKFKTDVVSFFKSSVITIERRRKTIQKALKKFINEAFGDDTIENTTPAKRLISGEKIYQDGNIEELVNSHGYNVEHHTVVTTDGYILMVHRILPALLNETNFNSGTVLLHHGLLGSSDDWVLLGPKKSLPYLLVDACYDVWLTNARGNKYSTGHISRTKEDGKFWKFSWHEIGQYDLSSVIDYIQNQNDKVEQLHFIGHSMGCTALLALLSTYPGYNQLLKSAVLLAPLAFMYEIKGPMRLLADFYNQHKQLSLQYLGDHDFVTLQNFPKNFLNKFCIGSEILCSNPLLLLANGGQEISNVTLKNNILRNVPGGGSMRTIIHYIQLVKSGQFQMFDMGKSKNLKIYGRVSPPTYRLNDVTLPVALFTSSDDWLSTNRDVQSLLSNLPNPVIHHVVRRNEFSHTDFVWAEDADVLVYYLILDVIKLISLGTTDMD
ncbi:hypothetical protein ABMA27_000422 [Loxostege sticticalis]|uniref:Partial AB-hydrolase lipase domain-containing protein n=1 Tax=Loxostege sticticalis TaxID=481309 RepID=A0ABR3INF5_LOXSC